MFKKKSPKDSFGAFLFIIRENHMQTLGQTVNVTAVKTDKIMG